MSYIRSDEAGKFLAYLAESNNCEKENIQVVNGSSEGTISLREVIEYVEKKTDGKAVLSSEGEPAPYNGEVEYSINTKKAQKLGFTFSNIHDWIYELLDYYIGEEIGR